MRLLSYCCKSSINRVAISPSVCHQAISPKSDQNQVQMNRWIKITSYFPHVFAQMHEKTCTFHTFLSSIVISLSIENRHIFLVKGVLHEKMDSSGYYPPILS